MRSATEALSLSYPLLFFTFPSATNRTAPIAVPLLLVLLTLQPLPLATGMLPMVYTTY